MSHYCLKMIKAPALAIVTWRTEYDTSDYHQARPKLRGAAALLREDLHRRLIDQDGDLLVIRDFIAGSAGLAGEDLAAGSTSTRQPLDP